MEKMNQVSVSEFFAKSKEELYDEAVEMVEKYNRLIDRHAVYTNALNNDIAEKAAKIEKLEKEIEGRKECYTALKELVDTKYISIDEHNDICKAYEKKIVDSIKDWKATADDNGLENQRFRLKIVKLEEEVEKLKVDLIHEREKNEKLAKDHAELENDIRKYTTEIKTLEEKVKHQRENLDGINKTLEIRTKENERLIAVKNNQDKEIEAHESENKRLSDKIMELKKERDKYMARVNDLRMELDCVKTSKEKLGKQVEELRECRERAEKRYVSECKLAEEKCNEVENLEDDITALRTANRILVEKSKEHLDEIKKLEEENKDLKVRDEELTKQISNKLSDIDSLRKYITHWKNQERIRTDQLRATESKVEELWDEIEKLKNEKKEGDDYAREGFKLYVKSALIEAEGNKNEANEVITEAVRSAYAEWSKTQKEEETEVKGVGRTNSGRYPWGAKVNDIPCGSDAIE